MELTTYAGLDVHKDSIEVCLLCLPSGELKTASFGGDPKAAAKLVRWLKREAEGPLQCASEAGPTGYWLRRYLLEQGLACEVVAAALTPRKPGERVNTDRRDARKLAEYLAAGLLTVVQPPTEHEEAVRSLVRCRDDARVALHRIRQQVLKFLLLRGLRPPQKARAWTLAHRTWVAGLRLSDAAAQFALEDLRLTLSQAEERLKSLDRKLEELAASEEFAERVGLLRCFRGIATLSARILLGELHGFGRFTSARGLMAYLGLVPSEDSSGARIRRGSIPKAGNSLVRRVLVEAAHSARLAPQLAPRLRRRQAGQPAEVVALAQAAMVRLHRRYWRLVGRGKHKGTVAVALARELAGFLWAALYPQACAAVTG